MAEFILPPVARDPDELQEQVVDYLSTAIPGWEPREGQLDWWLIEAFCEIAAQIGESVEFVLRRIFRYFGAELIGVRPVEATAAQTTVRVTLIEDDSDPPIDRTLPAGTQIAWTGPDGVGVAFEVVEDVVVPARETVANGVAVVALEPGEAGNGLSGEADLIDALDIVETIVAEQATAGGVGEEDEDVYIGRLVEELRLLTPRPILPGDFATLARRTGGIARATAVNGYDPGNDTTDNERMVAVYVVDELGEPVPSRTRAACADALAEMREVNFVVHVEDPTYTVVDVTFEATVYPGWDVAETIAAAEAAVTAYLSPSTWGTLPFGDQARPEWLNRTTVRYLEVASVINGVEGIDEVVTLTLGADGGRQDAADVALDGVVALPRAGEVRGSAA